MAAMVPPIVFPSTNSLLLVFLQDLHGVFLEGSQKAKGPCGPCDFLQIRHLSHYQDAGRLSDKGAKGQFLPEIGADIHPYYS